MSWNIKQKLRSLLQAETNLCPHGQARGGQLKICIVSPSRYQTGMSSLGFQTIYSLLASSAGIMCERAFLPDKEDLKEYHRSGLPLLSLESQRPLSDFDVLAFSTSFEPDYLNIPLILQLAQIPIWAKERTASNPLVVAGGAAFFINPEPAADFLDIICIGEGEELVPALVSALLTSYSDGRHGLYMALSAQPGFYIPSFHQPLYKDDRFTGFNNNPDIPEHIKRPSCELNQHPPSSSVILTPNTEFGDMFLVEVSRGCPRGCRFCTSGFIYGTFRQQECRRILDIAEKGLLHRPKIGLVGAAVSDHSDIGLACSSIIRKGGKVSVSSLRIDCIDTEMLEALVASGHKTISIAPEGGSQRLRDLIKKNLNEAQILDACDMLIARDILNLKLYVIIGLPTETEGDLDELVHLVTMIRERMVVRAKTNCRLGDITVSVNPFIPKPFTPFQWCGMEPLPSLERKVKSLENRFRRIPNVHLKVESLKGCYLQALLSRGDRRCAALLAEMVNSSPLKKAAKTCNMDLDELVYRTIPLDEPLPWGILESADVRMLRKEYERAFGGGVIK